MKCPNCGSDVSEGARFCDTCGAPISTTVPDNSAASSVQDASIPDSSDATISNTASLDADSATGNIPDASIPDTTSADAVIPDLSTPDLSSGIPAPSPEYQPEPAAQPAEPAPERVLHYEVVTPADQSNAGKTSSLGITSLILGIAGIIFSCVGCGGILSVIGLITGYLSLKTAGRQNGIIGLILSGIGLIISIVAICIIAVLAITSFSSGNRGY
jgi:hypothetical protein